MPVSPVPPVAPGWRSIDEGPVPLRCWWSPTPDALSDAPTLRKRSVLVLPEVFGANAWVRSVADRLAAAGVPALAMPLFARTAPALDLSYGEMQLADGPEAIRQPLPLGLLASRAAVGRGGAVIVRTARVAGSSLSSFFTSGVFRGVRNMIMLRPSRLGGCWISAGSSRSFAIRRSRVSASAVC